MPLMIRYPKRIDAGQRFDTLVENVDFGPTLLILQALPFHQQSRPFFRSLLETGEGQTTGRKQHTIAIGCHGSS